MISLYRVGHVIQTICVENRWRFCFVGGMALQRWGEPRITEDVDLTLLTGFQNEELFIDELLRHFKPRLTDAKDFALVNRVLLLETDEGIGIDVSMGGLPFEELIVDRATPFEFLPDISLLTCSAEDLIVLKAFADRPQDWEDIAGVVIRQQTLDWNYIDAQLRPLVELKEAPHILDNLSRLRQGK